MLYGFEKPGPNLSSSYLAILDLHSNMLQGSIPIPPPSIVILDYSNNKFTSTIPSDFSTNLYFAIFISLSSNHLNGEIPLSICETISSLVLDLSNNHFNGSVPPCLGSHGSLRVLKLRNNNLLGTMPKTFGEGCSLRTLDLNQNHLEGSLPRSLANCESLEVLDLGNNHMNGSFPFWLEKLPQLRVLVLRSNNLNGPIRQSRTDNAFPMLQIVDLSSNYFRGNLPSKWFRSWKAMMKRDDSQLRQIIEFNLLELNELYYQDSVTVTTKGLEMDFVKILTIFTSIDLSNNQFVGEIPEVVGDLESLHGLNMSQNQLTGGIPSSFGNLKELESLDLSQNMLSGTIPLQLSMLTFLSVLNLSQNLLVGQIPRGSQLDTFTAASFGGNMGLCGLPLSKRCQEALPPTGPKRVTNTSASKSLWGLDWEYFWIGFGCGKGMGVVVGVVAGIVISNAIMRKRGRRIRHRNIRQL